MELKLASASVAMILIVFLSFTSNTWAASGGRMGGGFSSGGSSSSGGATFTHIGGIIKIILYVTGLIFLIIYCIYICLKGPTTILLIQVGLSAKARSVQRQLNDVAKTTDTSSPEGWHRVLTKTTSALLQNPHYFISGFANMQRHTSVGCTKNIFNQLSNQEREKFDVEALVNVNNVRIQREATPDQASKADKDYIVVTILVAAKGAHCVPAIRSSKDLKDALQHSLNIDCKKLLAVEVLWTPQHENDALSKQGLLQNFPLLTRVY